MRWTRPSTWSRCSGRTFKVPLIAVDAQRALPRASSPASPSPERKRKIIGEEFIRCFEEEARKLTDARFLVQGTLYSDVIESGTRQAAKIKSHHNVGGLPEKMGFELVEPLRLLFKDEVRAVGEELGLPERIVWRQPFPGPGLAIRIIGEVTAERVDILQRADAILQEEIRSAGLYRELWQCFAVLPVIRSVGVQGDERTYAYPIVIRAVKSDDAMTADWARLPYDLLERSATRIINEVRRGQPRGLRHHEQAAEHDRVGVTDGGGAAFAPPRTAPLGDRARSRPASIARRLYPSPGFACLLRARRRTCCA